MCSRLAQAEHTCLLCSIHLGTNGSPPSRKPGAKSKGSSRCACSCSMPPVYLATHLQRARNTCQTNHATCLVHSLVESYVHVSSCACNCQLIDRCKGQSSWAGMQPDAYHLCVCLQVLIPVLALMHDNQAHRYIFLHAPICHHGLTRYILCYCQPHVLCNHGLAIVLSALDWHAAQSLKLLCLPVGCGPESLTLRVHVPE